MNKPLLALLFVLISGTALAYDFGQGSIDIPQGFEGPTISKLGPGAKTTAFTRPHDSNSGTALLITTWKPGKSLPKMSRDELQMGSRRYLLQFLGGIENRRENFKRSDVTFITISGQPAAKVEWSGTAQGKEMQGVMYSMIHKSTVLNLHTQDFSRYKGKFTEMAVKAIESMSLER